jgi:predicted nucleic acid-binding protein
LKASVESIGRPQEDFDLLIAATAAVHRLCVVTRNTKHFDDSGVKTFNPWSGH